MRYCLYFTPTPGRWVFAGDYVTPDEVKAREAAHRSWWPDAMFKVVMKTVVVRPDTFLSEIPGAGP